VKYIWSSGQKDRMKFISSGDKEMTTELTKLIHPDYLPKVYGGNLDYSPPKRCSYEEIMSQLKCIPKKEYLLQTIKNGDKFVKDFTVTAGDNLIDTWIHYNFKTQDHNVKFYVTFQGKEAKPVSIIDEAEYNSHQIPVFGRFKIDQPGKYSLVWDNTASWFNSKNLSYHITTGNRQ